MRLDNSSSLHLQALLPVAIRNAPILTSAIWLCYLKFEPYINESISTPIDLAQFLLDIINMLMPVAVWTQTLEESAILYCFYYSFLVFCV